MAVHHNSPEPDPEMTEKPLLGIRGKNKLERGRTGHVRLGSSAQLGTSIATFSTDGAHHLSKQNHLTKTMQCAGPRTHGQNVSTDYSPGPYSHHVCVSNTDTCTTFRTLD